MKMTNRKLSLLAALVISMTCTTAMPIYAAQDIKLIVNYRQTTGAKPILKEGSTLVPIRIISETLGSTVEWDPETKQITISDDKTDIQMTIGNPNVRVNNVAQKIPTAPIIHKGSTMLPIRFVGEALDAKVHWDNKAKTVTVIGKELTQAPNPKFTHDQWAREVRTTDLPSNAGVFPYIAQGVPNWVYENINMTAPNLIAKSGIKSFPNEYFYSDFDHDKAVKVLEKHFNTVLNVNYETINREQFKSYVVETFYEDSFKYTGFSNLDWADAFVDHVIDNKIITKGSATILPEMFWQNNANQQVVSAHVKLEVLQQGSQTLNAFQDFGGFPRGQSLTGKIPYMKTNKTYEGLVQFKLINYKVDYNTSSIGSQIHPEPNGFGGAYTAK